MKCLRSACERLSGRIPKDPMESRSWGDCPASLFQGLLFFSLFERDISHAPPSLASRSTLIYCTPFNGRVSGRVLRDQIHKLKNRLYVDSVPGRAWSQYIQGNFCGDPDGSRTSPSRTAESSVGWSHVLYPVSRSHVFLSSYVANRKFFAPALVRVRATDTLLRLPSFSSRFAISSIRYTHAYKAARPKNVHPGPATIQRHTHTSPHSASDLPLVIKRIRAVRYTLPLPVFSREGPLFSPFLLLPCFPSRTSGRLQFERERDKL